MTRTRRLITIALCAAVTGSALLPNFIQADPKNAATQKAAGAGEEAKRDLAAIDTELKAAGQEFHKAVPDPKLIADAKFRKENAAKALPPIKKTAALLREAATDHNVPSAMDARYNFLMLAVALGDEESIKALTEAGEGKDAEDALAARSALTLGTWVSKSDDAKAQVKILDDYIALAKTDVKNEKYSGTLMVMSQLGAANDELSRKAINFVRSNMKTENVRQMNTQTAALDKPIAIVGRTTTNTRFNSTSLKGKVILVDFWATWCGPCRQALPGIKKLYGTYHPKGLEIIGISCDSDDEKVNRFTKENAMPWVQLRDQSQNDQDSWHPLAKRYGIEGIPAIFLIDKKGVLRYLDGETDTEERIKQLLAEPDPEPVKPAAPAPAK